MTATQVSHAEERMGTGSGNAALARNADPVAWVLQELGRPPYLLRAEAKPLWEDAFRVNVYQKFDVGVSAKEIAVTDSFFVVRVSDGFVSNPEILRRY